MLSARFHKMEILSAPAHSQLFQLLTFLPKNGSLFYLAIKFAAVPAAVKNPNFWKIGFDIVKSAAVPKIANIGKFWKRAIKKRKRFPLPSIFLFLTPLHFSSLFLFLPHLGIPGNFLLFGNSCLFCLFLLSFQF